MNDDNRSYEASSLRAFFDRQIFHIQELVTVLVSHINNIEQLTEEDRQIVESFVDASNSKMRAVPDYSQKLREHVRALYNHVFQIANEIPLPILLSVDTIKTDPLINAMFISSNDINRLVNTNPDLLAYLHSHNKYDAPILYAFLTARKCEKHTFGVGMQGDMLIRDVPQQAVNFLSHKIHTPCASSAELSVAIKLYLFRRVEMLINQSMATRITNRPFKLGDNSYHSRLNSLSNPNVYLNTLIEYLEFPAQLLSIQKTHFKLSKMNIKLENVDRQSANEFDIHELTWLDNTQEVVLKIAYRR